MINCSQCYSASEAPPRPRVNKMSQCLPRAVATLWRRFSLPNLLTSSSTSRPYSSTKGKVPENDKNLKPYSVNKLRSWNSRWGVPPRSKKFGKEKMAELTVDDLFITKFIRGTFPMNPDNPIIISRKENIINITLPLMMDPFTVNFLVGYSEKILSEWLGCQVNVNPSCVLPKDYLT